MIASDLFEQVLTQVNDGVANLPELEDGDILELNVIDGILIKASVASKYEISLSQEILLGVERRRYRPSPEQVQQLNWLRTLIIL